MVEATTIVPANNIKLFCADIIIMYRGEYTTQWFKKRFLFQPKISNFIITSTFYIMYFGTAV